MIEVFKTNVSRQDQASFLLGKISTTFTGYYGNFDLEDCDKILRIQADGSIDTLALVRFLSTFGFTVSVLPDVAQDVLMSFDVEQTPIRHV